MKVEPVQTLSLFTRVTQQGDATVTKQIRYIEDRGLTKVEVVSFTTYNNRGREIEHTQKGSNIDRLA